MPGAVLRAVPGTECSNAYSAICSAPANSRTNCHGTCFVDVGNLLLCDVVVEELLLGGDHAVQELKGEEVDADVGGRVHQGPILPRKGHCSNLPKGYCTCIHCLVDLHLV
jgi:hypothetical protein